MREIKFRQAIKAHRAYFNANVPNEELPFKEWHYWGYILDTGHYDTFIGPIGKVEWDDRPSYQYTGLKDENGKESYHKDIIKRLGKLYIMEWHNNLGGWFLNPLHGGWHGTTRTNMALMCEIIGNVSENPELLEVKP